MKKRFAFRISEDLLEKVKDKADRKGENTSRFIRGLCRRAVGEHNAVDELKARVDNLEQEVQQIKQTIDRMRQIAGGY